MLIKKWKIRIQSDGRPAITFPKGRQDGVLLPEAEDIELSDEGLIFSISRWGKITRYECPFNELGYTAPPTPIAQLQAMRCVSNIPQGHILIFLYEFICGVLTEATPYIIKKQPFDMYELAEQYFQCKQIEGVSLKKIREADILLDDDTRKYISMDEKNQYLIIGRNPKNLFTTSDNLFELVSEKKGEQTEFRLKKYL